MYGVKPDPMELPNTAIDGSVSLHAAAAAGHVPTVRELLNCGHELNARNSRGQTPLSMAAKHGHLEVAKELLSQPGIDVNAVDLERRTALYWAASRNRPQVLRVLLENEQIQPQIETEWAETPLEIAMDMGYSEAVVVFDGAGVCDQ